MKKLTFIIFCILSYSVFGQVDYTYYSRAEVDQDIWFAFENLINIHPVFLDENEIIHYQDQFYEIEKSIKDSMTQSEVYLLLAPLFALLNDGHTGVIVPTDQRLEYMKSGGKSFPFFVDISNDSIYVSFYCGNDASLFQGGEQILKINGIDATCMVHNMESLFSGELSSIKHRGIADRFRLLIWMIYGFEDDYELLVKTNQNEIRQITISGVTNDEFLENIKRMPKSNQPNYSFDLFEDNKTALLKIKSFGDLDGFCAFADSAFAIINKKEIENLIIDIRNNLGGRSVVVDSLMNYIYNDEYAQYKKIEMRISKELQERYNVRYPDRYEWISNFAIDSVVNQGSNTIHPLNTKNHYNGKLFLLTNTLTYSAAASFAGMFRELELGIIIGEETGGRIEYYGDYWFIEAPNTKINFHVSPKRFIQYGGTDYNRGVIPDFIVADKDDAILNYTKDLINNR